MKQVIYIFIYFIQVSPKPSHALPESRPVLICFGVADTIFSISFGPYFGRAPLYSFGTVVNFAVVRGMYLWEPKENSTYEELFQW